MSNLSFIVPILAVATLGVGALYLISGKDENKVDEYEYEMPKINPTDPSLYNSSSGEEAAIGGFKTKRYKNKYMKKKSKSRRKSSKKSKK
jgi:hypothetical protein